ncbi:hypothetical protein V6N13_067747 [Hibiscus sabdariffa]
MKSAHGVTLFLLFLLSSAHVFNYSESTQVNGSSEMVPLVDERTVKMTMFNESRRKLGSFQICAACTCCGGAKELSSLAYCSYHVLKYEALVCCLISRWCPGKESPGRHRMSCQFPAGHALKM